TCRRKGSSGDRAGRKCRTKNQVADVHIGRDAEKSISLRAAGCRSSADEDAAEARRTSKHRSAVDPSGCSVSNIMLLIDIGKDCRTASFTWTGSAKRVVWNSAPG